MLDSLEECEDWDTEQLPAVASGRIFKMGRGRPIRVADIGTHNAYLSEFHADLWIYCRKQYGSNFIEDPKIFILNSVNMRYPTWIQDEIMAEGEGMQPAEYLPISDHTMASVRINTNDHFHHEAAIVNCPARQP